MFILFYNFDENKIKIHDLNSQTLTPDSYSDFESKQRRLIRFVCLIGFVIINYRKPTVKSSENTQKPFFNKINES